MEKRFACAVYLKLLREMDEDFYKTSLSLFEIIVVDVALKEKKISEKV